MEMTSSRSVQYTRRSWPKPMVYFPLLTPSWASNSSCTHNIIPDPSVILLSLNLSLSLSLSLRLFIFEMINLSTRFCVSIRPPQAYWRKISCITFLPHLKWPNTHSREVSRITKQSNPNNPGSLTSLSPTFHFCHDHPDHLALLVPVPRFDQYKISIHTFFLRLT